MPQKRRPTVVDLHEDISYYYVNHPDDLAFRRDDYAKDLPLRDTDIPKFRRGNVSLVFSAIFCLAPTVNLTSGRMMARGYGMDDRGYQGSNSAHGASSAALDHLKVYYALAEEHSKHIHLVRTAKDLGRAEAGKSIGFLLALEGAYALEDVYDLDLFYNMGLRSLGLVWNFDTRYCASCMSKKDYGLTGEGEELVKRCNQLGVIIDLVHASRKTHLEVTKLSKLPLMNTHSNAKAVHDISRTLDDEMYEAIKKNGGVVGSVIEATMVGGKQDLQSLVDHIMYVHERFGADITAIGTDYFGLSRAVTGLEDISKIGNLFDALGRRGMSREDIDKLAYKNAMRVIHANAKRWK
ncbi:MAG: membrane dipeptidase [Thaumarchaeota archaeon]|nr:membrane dipeptidase [Nitrososphaerota archaeon]